MGKAVLTVKSLLGTALTILINIFKEVFVMKRRVLAMSMAAVTALTSTSICAFAEGQDSKALASAISVAKTRLDIPEELTEFSYKAVNSNLNDAYYLTWSTPRDAQEFKEVTVQVCRSLITSYYTSDYGYSNTGKTLAKLSGDKLYEKAKELIKKINPTVAGVIDLDRDSLYISTYNDRAVFSFVRTKNGIPVKNDNGQIVLNKNTGELISFYMSWHEKASFQSADSAISLDLAKDKYAAMIDIQPQYEFYYDWESKELKSRLVYRQSSYGEINAFTGKKSDFAADGYYDTAATNGITADTAESDESPADGGYKFTEQEQAELDKKLPYASEEAVVKLLRSDPYLTYKTDMELSYSDLYKITVGENTRYYYTASFTNENWGSEEDIMPVPVANDEWVSSEMLEVAYSEKLIESYQNVNICVDAESGQIISYYYYDSTAQNGDASYDLSKADKLAEEIAKKFAGDSFGEFGDYSSSVNSWTERTTNKTQYWGSDHSWTRYANDIKVSGDSISVSLNADMKLTSYYINYTDIELADPAGMLTAKQAMSKFWENNDLNLYYLAKLNNKITKTVLVYGTDNSVYVDAFTGEPVYSYYTRQENDLSGIKDKKLLAMAQKLDDHGFVISTEKFSENDPAAKTVLESLMGVRSDENESDKNLTRGEALVIFTKSVCGDTIPELKGIYKSPFSDVKDTDENVGYYAIAYGFGVVSGDKLNAKDDFTMGDMIKMVYTLYSAQ